MGNAPAKPSFPSQMQWDAYLNELNTKIDNQLQDQKTRIDTQIKKISDEHNTVVIERTTNVGIAFNEYMAECHDCGLLRNLFRNRKCTEARENLMHKCIDIANSGIKKMEADNKIGEFEELKNNLNLANHKHLSNYIYDKPKKVIVETRIG